MKLRFCVCPLLVFLITSSVSLAQSPRLPKTDWQALAHGVWIASASVKSGQVELHLSVPMWTPAPTPTPTPQSKDATAPNDKNAPSAQPAFVASELKSVLKASDVKVYRKNGSVVETKDLPRLLARETYVLWGQEKIDPYFLTVMRDDVLIVVVDMQKVFKAQVQHGKPGDAPPPPPSK